MGLTHRRIGCCASFCDFFGAWQNLRLFYSGGNTTISVDSDGLANGAGVDQVITLVGYNTGGLDSASILQYMLTNGDLFAS